MAKRPKILRDGRFWVDYYRDSDPQVNTGINDGKTQPDPFTPKQLDFLLEVRRLRKLGRLLDWWESVRSKETDRDA